MIKACKDHLAAALAAAGIERVFYRREEAEKHQVLPFGVLMTGDETLRFDGSLVASAEGPGNDERTYRRRTHRRVRDIKVAIIHRSDDQAETAGETFLAALDRRIFDGDGNAILVSARGSEPDEDDKSLLRQRSGAVYLVTFEGGVYQDKVVKVLPLETALEVE